MSNSEKFLKAADDIKNLKSKPTDQELLEIYGLFKQATAGDVNISRPGMFALKEKAKWDAWNALKGMSKEEAERNYINKSEYLVETYNK